MNFKMVNRLIIILNVVLLLMTSFAYAVDEGDDRDTTITDGVTEDEYKVQCQELDEYEGITVDQDYWYDNLPIYTKETIELSVDTESLQSFCKDGIVDDLKSLCESIASIQVSRLSDTGNPFFNCWHGANLSLPIEIFNPDESLYGYAFGVIDSKYKVVGYIITGADLFSPPVLEYSYDPIKFEILSNSEKVYFDSSCGLLVSDGRKIRSISGEWEFKKEDFLKLTADQNYDKYDEVMLYK